MQLVSEISTNVTDRGSDRQTDDMRVSTFLMAHQHMQSQYHATHYSASCGKNTEKYSTLCIYVLL